MTALLRFEQVACRRGGRWVFEALDLELCAGERLLLTGPNGSGKSSLLRLAGGLLRPAAGRIRGTEAALADELPALDGELPLRRALQFWARLGGRPERLDAAMDALGISHLCAVPVRLLSAGQRRRAALARVVASPARLWLLDEPANALDAGGVTQLTAAIDRHCAGGGAVLAASHLALGESWRTLALAS